MSNKPTRLSLLGFLILSVSLPVLAEVDGQALYRQTCVKCHADDGSASTWRGWLYSAQNLSSAKWQDKSSDADILEAIQDGPGAMPSYASKLSTAEQQALIQVVRDLRAP